MNAYSMDLRERVVAACDAGDATREQVAARFSVSVRWIRDSSCFTSPTDTAGTDVITTLTLDGG
jgi:hypothetical protein